MTIILEQQPPTQNFMVVKRYLSKGDRIIFQWDESPALKEQEVIVTDVIMEPGLMKGYSVVGWEAAKGV